MDEAHELLAKMQTLGLDAYVHKDASSIKGLPAEALAEGVRGLLLSAPASLDGQTVSPVPGVLLMARSQARTDALPFRDSAVVVATDLERGGSYAGPGFVVNPAKVPPGIAGRAKPAAAPPRPVRSPEEEAMLDSIGHGDSAALLWFDFRQLLNLPRESARYLLRVIDFDEASNPAPLQVTMLPASQDGVTVEAADAVMARTRAASQSGGFPRYEREALTPTLNGPGAALVVGEASFQDAARHVPVHGVFRIQLTHPMIVAGTPAHAAAGTRRPGAVVRASVLVLMKGVARPMHARLEVPIFADYELREGNFAEAVFAIDLATVLPQKPRPGVYQVYLLAGPYLSGPHALTVPAGG